MSNVLPLVDLFPVPYEAWSTRRATQEEMLEHANRTGRLCLEVNHRLEETITNATEAAFRTARTWGDSKLANHINLILDHDENYDQWRKAMPSTTSKALSDYQQKFPRYDLLQLQSDIKGIAAVLSDGQALFHGGLWPDCHSFTTTAPLSCTFCPQVALQEAVHRGKAQQAGRIDLFVLRASEAITNVFAYRRKGTKMGHENEILFAAGAKLCLVSKTIACTSFPVGLHGEVDKVIPIYVVEAAIS